MTAAASRLTGDGEKLLDYARRIVRLNGECVAAFADTDLAGRVRLGLPDDYADRYLPDILASFSRSNPRVEVSVMCEPTPMLIDRIAEDELDLAIITHVEGRTASEVLRTEPLLWVGSGRHQIHRDQPLPPPPSAATPAAGARPPSRHSRPARGRIASPM